MVIESKTVKMYPVFPKVIVFLFFSGYTMGTEDEKNAKTLKYTNNLEKDGSYEFSFLTNNSISHSETSKRKENSDPPEFKVTGKYYFLSPEGYFIRVTYESGKDGYRPKTEIINPNVEVEDRINYAALASLQGGGIGKR